MADTPKPLYQKLLPVPLTLTVIALTALAVQFLTASRPFIGGVDFYYYILNARDLADGTGGAPPTRYVYFPGVYSFWTTILRITDGGLAALQWAYAGVMLTNSILIGCILATVTRIWQAGLFATALYLFMASRVEGLYGVTEPITTIPFLAGLWLWVLLSDTDRPRAALAALAVGFGFALFSKQQGGLLLLGAFGLLQDSALIARPLRQRLAVVTAVAVGAVLVFLCAMLLEGGGIEAVQMGLRFVTEYQPEGHWLQNLRRAYDATRPVSDLFLSACAIWLALAITPRKFPELPPVMLPLLGLAVISALSSLLQFGKRGHLHYALLFQPSAVIAGGLALYIVAFFLNRQTRRWPRFAEATMVIGMASFLLVNSAGTTDFVRYVSSQIAVPTKWMQHETLRQVFAPLCARVEPGSGLLLIPQRQGIIHWECRTRAVSPVMGYQWISMEAAYYLDVASSPEAAGVFLFAERSGDYEQLFFRDNDRARIIRELERLGFRETFSFDAGQLYQKTGKDRLGPSYDRRRAQTRIESPYGNATRGMNRRSNSKIAASARFTGAGGTDRA
jgi:hypothetical protein